jgi:D-3-phosphoglycerate dehydrogenase
MTVLFIDSTHPILEKLFEENSFDCDYIYGKSYNYYSEIVENYDGIIIRSGINLDKNIIDKAKKLKFIGRLGAGLENIDVKYAESKNIKCFNSPEGNRDAVGEHALGMLLCLFNNLRKADREVRELKWLREENRGVEIKGKTIGIIGYGNMGSAFAKRLQGFGANVIAYDKYKSNYGNG